MTLTLFAERDARSRHGNIALSGSALYLARQEVRSFQDLLDTLRVEMSVSFQALLNNFHVERPVSFQALLCSFARAESNTSSRVLRYSLLVVWLSSLPDVKAF